MESDLEGNEIADAESEAWKTGETRNEALVQNDAIEDNRDDSLSHNSPDKADSNDADDKDERDLENQLGDDIDGLNAPHLVTTEALGQDNISNESKRDGDELSGNKILDDMQYSALRYSHTDDGTAISSSSGAELSLNPATGVDKMYHRSSLSPRPEAEITTKIASSKKRRKSKVVAPAIQQSFPTETFSELLTSPETNLAAKSVIYGGQHGVCDTNTSSYIDQTPCSSTLYGQSPRGGSKYSTPDSALSGRINFDASGNVMDWTPRSNIRPHLDDHYAGYSEHQYSAPSHPARDVRMTMAQAQMIPNSDSYVHATLAQLLTGPVVGYANGNYNQAPGSNIFEEEVIRMRSILSQHADLIPPPVEIIRLTVLQNQEVLQSAIAYSSHLQDAYGSIMQQQVFDHSRLQQTPQMHPGENGSSPYTPWQSENDIQLRREMIGKIISLLQARKPDAPPEWLRRLPDMARRLEDTLYRMAKNRDEYGNFTTLKSRLQHLAFTMGRRPPQYVNPSMHVPTNHDYMQESPAFSAGMNPGVASQQGYMLSGNSQHSSNPNAMNGSHLQHQSPMLELPNPSLRHSESRQQHQSDHIQRDYHCQQRLYNEHPSQVQYATHRFRSDQQGLGPYTNHPVSHHHEADKSFYAMVGSQYDSASLTEAGAKSDHMNVDIYQGYSMDERPSNEASMSEANRNNQLSGGNKRTTRQEATNANHSTSKRAKTGRKSTQKRSSSSPPPSTANNDLNHFPNSNGNTSEYRNHSHLPSQNNKSIET